MTRILVIDDEPAIRKLLTTALISYGFEVFFAENGDSGLREASTRRPEIILLDLGLPDRSGLDILKNLRQWFDGGIIILSVRNEEDIIVSELADGADDYVCKPFGVPELVARINVCFRLRQRLLTQTSTSIWEHEHLHVDFLKRLVYRDSEEVKLTGTEYDLLVYFIRNRGKILTHAQILKALWGPNAGEHRQYLRVYVQHLRQKIEAQPSSPKLIVTETGIGYRLKA